MHKIDRRKLMVSGAIGAAALTVAAVPTIGLATSLKAAPGKDRLFDLIELYKTQTKDLHEQCRKRDMDDLWLTCAAPTSPAALRRLSIRPSYYAGAGALPHHTLAR